MDTTLTTDTLGKAMATSPTPIFQFNGRWYIAMGQPGFNCKANNRDGFSKAKQAFDTIDRYTAKGQTR